MQVNIKDADLQIAFAVCHARMLLSGIHCADWQVRLAVNRFPLTACGNDVRCESCATFAGTIKIELIQSRQFLILLLLELTVQQALN
jgi:hypothetical protein